MINKKGQIAIFAIIALIIVAAIVLIFFLISPPETEVNAVKNPQGHIEVCVGLGLEEVENIILTNNGFMQEPDDNFILYNGKKIPYLCKSTEFYAGCMPQEPMFIGNIRKDIGEYMQPIIRDCFRATKEDLERAGYGVQEEDLSIEVELREKSLGIVMNRKVDIAKGDDKRSFDKFQSEINTPLYDLAELAHLIVNYETSFCEFDYIDWMGRNRDEGIVIKRYRGGSQVKYYTLIHEATEKELEFAIRTCVLPAGI